ncbi:MAG TPA: type II secretion system F family protein [archaeon]|nr:type II secretion system F family protein [archaeon]
MIRFSSITARFGPSKYKAWVNKHLVYADMTWQFDKFVSMCYLYSLAFSIVAVFILTVFLQYTFLLSFAVSQFVFIISFLTFHFILSVIAENRAKTVEEVLPDVLKLVAINLKSGMTVDRALLLSARPEFGIMEKEIKTVSQKVISGVPVEKALDHFTERILSPLLTRTMRLVKEGLDKGGELAVLLEQIANDMVHTKTLRKEVAAQVGMYAIFIFFAVGIGAPMMYGVSTYLVKTMTKITGGLDIGAASTAHVSSIKFQKINIDTNFLTSYQLVSLLITAIFGGLLLGLLKDGKEKAGVKYIPILIVMDIGIYFVANVMLGSVLGV